MSTSLFSQNFSGDKHVGFNVMSQNCKLEQKTVSDFSEFLRESYAFDDTTHRSMMKFSKQVTNYNFSGTFKHYWLVLKKFFEQLAQVNLNMSKERQMLCKDVHKYIEEQHKVQKLIKETDLSCQEVSHAFQAATMHLQKSKETYYSRYFDYKRNSRDREKLEAKLKKALDEYKYAIEKYNNLRGQFVNKMRSSCAYFQQVEFDHLSQMREFLQRYAFTWKSARDTTDKIYEELGNSILELTPDKLLTFFVDEKGTGSPEPPDVQFEDPENFGGLIDTQGATSMQLPIDNVTRRYARTSSSRSATNTDSVLSEGVSNENGLLVKISGSTASIPHGANLTSSTLTVKRRDKFFRRVQTAQDSPSVSIPSGAIAMADQTSKSTSTLAVATVFGTLRKNLGKTRSNVKLANTNIEPEVEWSKEFEDVQKDDEGYIIRSDDPWNDDKEKKLQASDDSDDDDSDDFGSTFHGIKVKIRPVGELAPAVVAQKLEDVKLLKPLPLPDNSLVLRQTSQSLLPSITNNSPTLLLPTCTSPSSLSPNMPISPSVGSMRHNKSNNHNRWTSNNCLTEERPRALFVDLDENDKIFDEISKLEQSDTNCDQEGDKMADLFFNFESELTENRKASSNNLSINTPEPNDTVKSTSSNWLTFDNNAPSSLQPSLLSLLSAPPSNSNQSTAPILPTMPIPAKPQQIPAPPARLKCSFPSSNTIQPLPVEGNSIAPKVMSFAAAFSETWNAHFYNGGGSSFSTVNQTCQPPVHSIQGCLSLAFAKAEIHDLLLSQCADYGPLVLKIKNSVRLKNLQVKIQGSYVSMSQNPNCFEYVLTIPCHLLMQQLVVMKQVQLDSQAPNSDASAWYVKLDVVHYIVDTNKSTQGMYEAYTPPIFLCTYWRCEPSSTDFRLDYSANWPRQESLSSTNTPGELKISLVVDGNVSSMQSIPVGTYLPEMKWALWRVPLFIDPNAKTSGTIRAKFALLNGGPAKPQPVNLQFLCDDLLASGVQLELVSQSNFQLTVCKRRLIGDRYMCDPPSNVNRFQAVDAPMPVGFPTAIVNNNNTDTDYVLANTDVLPVNTRKDLNPANAELSKHFDFNLFNSDYVTSSSTSKKPTVQ